MHRAPGPQQSVLRELEGPQGAGRGDQPIYTAASDESVEEELAAFEAGGSGQRFPIVAACWRRAWSNVIPFFAFPPAVRRVIYTTNSIESINASLRKIIKARGHFPSDDAAIKLIWRALRNITADWAGELQLEDGNDPFAILYKDRFTKGAGWYGDRLPHRVGGYSQAPSAAEEKSHPASHTEMLTLPLPPRPLFL